MKIDAFITCIVGAAIVSVPLCIMFVTTPAFTRLAEENANQESIKVATHLAESLSPDNGTISAQRLPPDFPAEIEKIRHDFNLLRLRVMAPSGEVVYSTSQKEIGTYNREAYFRDKVARGIVHSTVIRRGKSTLEGDIAAQDLAETYVPVIRSGKVIGAFEIYYDISGRIANLDQVKANSNTLLISVVAVLLAITTAVVYRARRHEAERDLARAEWEMTFDAVTEPVMIVNRDYSIARANRAMADWIGTTPEGAVGLACYQQVHHCNEPVSGCPNRKLLEDGKAHSSEVYDASSDRYFSVSVYPIFDSQGNLSGSVHYAKDVTTHKKAEEHLRLAEAKYRIVADNTYAWEFWLGPDSSYVYTSPSCERVTGYAPAEFTSDPGLFLNIVHPDDRHIVTVHQNEVANPETTGTTEFMFRIIRRDGDVRWIAHSCQPILDANGNFLGVRGSNSDVTERKLAVDALRESASSLAEAQRIAHIGSWENDLSRNAIRGSEETFRIFEFEGDCGQVSYRKLLERVHPEDRAMVDGNISQSLITPTPVEFVHRLLMDDGRVKYVLDHCETIFDEAGKPVKLVSTVQDVTQQKLAEETLRESEAKFKGLAASAQDAIIMMDNRGNVSFWNDSAVKVFGYSQEEAIGRELHDLIVPERYYHEFRQGFSGFQRSGEGAFVGRMLELQARRRDGSEFPVEFSVSALKSHGTWQAISILRDITERRRSEALIQQQLKTMTAVSDIGMTINSTLDARVTLNLLLERLLSQLKIDAATVLLLEKESHYLKWAASLGFRSASIRGTRVRMGKGHAGWVAYERQVLIVSELSDTLTNSLRDEDFQSYVGVPLIAHGRVLGVLELFHRSPLATSPELLGLLELMAAQAAIAIDNATMFQELQRSNTELTLAYDATLEGWGRTLEFRDEDTKGHTERVANMAEGFARLIGMGEQDIVHLRRGALLHDIGKIGIPDAILLKPGPLTPEEQKIMHQHTVYAYELLSPIPFLRPALDIPHYHHEKWDGSGMPRGLKGEEIPLAARIFAVVDVWDALISDRPYRAAWPLKKVIDYIRERAGIEFDPTVVELLLQHLEDENCEDLWKTRVQKG